MKDSLAALCPLSFPGVFEETNDEQLFSLVTNTTDLDGKRLHTRSFFPIISCFSRNRSGLCVT